ncbi:MAG: DUF4160 domain-containing protein [Schwartzia sp.]|nr:DUF4160 domain-containing protein [Schwartzia sp. (in: firmicutes)]
MPRALLDFLGYVIYFWTGDMNEPIHVHISKGEQTESATKVWITEDGVRLAHNGSHIPKKDLNALLRFIADNREEIAFRWMTTFNQRGELKKF